MMLWDRLIMITDVDKARQIENAKERRLNNAQVDHGADHELDIIESMPPRNMVFIRFYQFLIDFPTPHREVQRQQ